MKILLGIVLLLALALLTAGQIYLGRRGRNARAANGGKHTSVRWVSIGVVVVGGAIWLGAAH